MSRHTSFRCLVEGPVFIDDSRENLSGLFKFDAETARRRGLPFWPWTAEGLPVRVVAAPEGGGCIIEPDDRGALPLARRRTRLEALAAEREIEDDERRARKRERDRARRATLKKRKKALDAKQRGRGR